MSIGIHAINHLLNIILIIIVGGINAQVEVLRADDLVNRDNTGYL